MFIGKFHGVMQAYTPLARRKVRTFLLGSAPGRTGVSSRFTSSAAQRKISADSSISPRASVAIGLPCSEVSCRARSSARSSRRSAVVWSSSARSNGGMASSTTCASRAAATVASTSAGLAVDTSARCSPVLGLCTARGWSAPPCTHWPPMRSSVRAIGALYGSLGRHFSTENVRRTVV